MTNIGNKTSMYAGIFFALIGIFKESLSYLTMKILALLRHNISLISFNRGHDVYKTGKAMIKIQFVANNMETSFSIDVVSFIKFKNWDAF